MFQVEVERRTKIFLKSEKMLQELSESTRRGNIRLMDIPEGEERDKGAGTYLKK